ncbi:MULTISPECIES: GNAT family N-acetyltransferase [Streptomyces]|uniref:GNAT family N-acetyltransferase n=2 Tax=Streptomyces TaxID=1883 RepID=A0ABQ7FFU0_9ACTN|nr:GNAT family N-acetyltransferase [Streptomyces lycii]KAF4407700.1 GNAT family N-acetyltransferase [Streptomyces lycii]PGH47527.1 GNAT family N-acetyltransferase [Streptomyces sp. Ru87]
MNDDDLPFVVREHQRHFPHGFFPHLGTAFLTAYTRAYPTSPHSLAFIAELDGRRVGFLVGVTDPVLHRRHVLRAHGHRLAGRAALALLRRPRLAWHFVRTRLPRYSQELTPHRGAEPDGTPPGARGPVAVLAHVAVLEQVRSLGIGTELVERFTRHAAAAGCSRVALVTASGGEGAGRYYQRHGWLRRGETRTPEGRRLVTYERALHLPAWLPGTATVEVAAEVLAEEAGAAAGGAAPDTGDGTDGHDLPANG